MKLIADLHIHSKYSRLSLIHISRELVEQRRQEQKEEQFKSYQKVTLDNLFSQIAEGEMKELPIVVKADVQGSAEAVKQSLEKLSNDEVRVRVIHTGVGAINRSDVMLANASNAIIIGFNVRPDPVAKEDAAQENVEMRMYRIIYDAIDDVKEDVYKRQTDPSHLQYCFAHFHHSFLEKVTVTLSVKQQAGDVYKRQKDGRGKAS